jgi:2-polyprenyl-3-methyl-5-hydroxy-6-metoxy-1,4-benzoquinol methylase/rRNA maturation protein Nop10
MESGAVGGASTMSAPECPACGTPAHPTRLLLEDRYRLFRCRSCRTQFLRAVADAPEGSSYWAHKQFKFDVYGAPDVQLDYDRRYRSVLERAASAAGPIRSVVDFGCGSGNFLSLAEREGLDATGVDLDASAVEAARSRGLRAFVPDELDAGVPDRSVDVATLWDVIEHITEPSEFLTDVLRKVRPHGLVIIETPDATFPLRPIARGLHYLSRGRIRLVRRLYYWEHKTYFSEAGLRRLIEANGGDVIAVIKMTSPRAKMSHLFEMSARGGRLEARIVNRLWPLMESATRKLGAGNKIVLIGRTAPT